MKVALLGSLATEQRERLRRLLGPSAASVELAHARDDASFEEMTRLLDGARVVVTLHYHPPMPRANDVQLLQAAGAGYDEIDFAHLPKDVTVCNAFGHEESISEYVLCGMLLWCTRILEADRTFRAGSWAMSGRMNAPFTAELGGQTVGILSLGRVAAAVARRTKCFGARVIACSRRAEAADGVDEVMPFDRIDEFLSRCDFVVVTTALTAETRGLIDRRRLALLRPTAVIINIARGPIVDETALYEALRDRTIGGAVLDTWYRYPSHEEDRVRPSRYPFHELANVVMTPHSSAWTEGMIERRWTTIAENIRRFAGGQPLLNVVHTT